MTTGYLYILANESMPGVFKVGCTSRSPFDRAKELRTTGVPTPFYVAAAIFVSDIKGIESKAHTLLDSQGVRVDEGREFFRTSLKNIILIFSQIAGEEVVSARDHTMPTFEQILYDAETYYLGRDSTPPDLKRSVELYEHAVQMSSAEAAKILSLIYIKGEGVRKSQQKADYYHRGRKELNEQLRNQLIEQSIHKFDEEMGGHLRTKRYALASQLAYKRGDYNAIQLLLGLRRLE